MGPSAFLLGSRLRVLTRAIPIGRFAFRADAGCLVFFTGHPLVPAPLAAEPLKRDSGHEVSICGPVCTVK
jgi:hypothetical protein